MEQQTVGQELLDRLKPGSHTSMRAGCKCDPFINHWGYGTGLGSGFAINPECRLHAPRDREGGVAEAKVSRFDY